MGSAPSKDYCTTPFPKLAEGWRPNAEGQELPAAIPFQELGITGPETLGPVTLVTRWYSPPSCGIRAILNYHKVEYKSLLMDLPFKKTIKNSKYKLSPQLIVKGGYQVNDSFYILKSLYPVLTGMSVSEDCGDEASVKKMVEDLVIGLRIMLVVENGKAKRMVPQILGNDPKERGSCLTSMLWKMVPMVSNSVHGKLKKQSPHDKKTFEELLREFMIEIQRRNTKIGSQGIFYSAQDEPGMIDLWTYGQFCCFTGMDELEDLVLKALRSAGAEGWFNAVDATYRQKASQLVIPMEHRFRF